MGTRSRRLNVVVVVPAAHHHVFWDPRHLRREEIEEIVPHPHALSESNRKFVRPDHLSQIEFRKPLLFGNHREETVISYQTVR